MSQYIFEYRLGLGFVRPFLQVTHLGTLRPSYATKPGEWRNVAGLLNHEKQRVSMPKNRFGSHWGLVGGSIHHVGVRAVGNVWSFLQFQAVLKIFWYVCQKDQMNQILWLFWRWRFMLREYKRPLFIIVKKKSIYIYIYRYIYIYIYPQVGGLLLTKIAGFPAWKSEAPPSAAAAMCGAHDFLFAAGVPGIVIDYFF